MSDLDIKSWSIYGVRKIGISMVEYENSGDKYYNPHVTYFLEDGKEHKDLSTMKCVTLVHDITMDCPKCLALNLIDMYSILYKDTSIAAIIIVFDEDFNEIDQFNIDQLEDHILSDDEEIDVQIPKNRVLH